VAEKIEIRRMEMMRRIYNSKARAAYGPPSRDRRTGHPGEEGTMRRITHWHRTLMVLAVGLLALAAPLVAYADATPSGH